MREPAHDRSRAYYLLRAWLLLAVLVAVAYGGSLTNGFVFDDAIFMERDARLDSGEGVRSLFIEPLWAGVNDDGGEGVHQYYRPLQLVPLAVSKIYFDGAAWPCHALSLLLHLLNGVLVYTILARVLDSEGVGLALAALFVVHPAASESVLWISDLAGLGASLCMLAAFRIHMRRAPTVLGSIACAVLYLGSMWFKESGMLLPALFAAYDLTVRPPSGRERGRGVAFGDYASLFAPLSVYLVLRDYALGGFLPGGDSLELGPVALAINAVALLPQYVATFFWTFDPNMYHDFVAAEGPGDPRFLIGLAIVAVAATTMILAWRTRPVVVFGIAWAAITVAPYLIARWPQLNVFAERYLYLPSLGVLAALAALTGAPAAARQRRSAATYATAATVIVALFLWVDVGRTKDWADEETIYTKTLTQSEDAPLIRNNLALRYLEEGNAAEGIPLQEELVRDKPDFPRGWHNLGLLYLAVGDNEGALGAFEQASRREPGSASTLLNLGYAYDLNGLREKAVETYFRLLGLRPASTEARYNLAVIAFETGQLANARRMLRELLDHDPNDAAAGTLLAQADVLGRPRNVVRPAPQLTLQRCGTARDAAEQGRYREAVAKLRMAAWFDEVSPLPHHYLANVYYMSGKLERAVLHQRLALDRDPDNALYRHNLASLEAWLDDPGRDLRQPAF